MRRTVLALIFLVPSIALAAVMVHLSLSELTNNADLVVVGKCVNKQFVKSGKAIFTDYTIQVSEVLKGATVKEVKVRQPGGEYGNRGVYVTGVARFTPAEEAMLFLDKPGKDGSRDMIGWSQGKFHIYYDDKTKARYAVQDLQEISLMKKSTGTITEPSVSRIELKQLQTQVKSIVADQKADKK